MTAAPNFHVEAAKLAQRGFRVFPLRPGAKRPLNKNWQQHATDDVFKALHEWPPGCCPGIATDGLVVLDADVDKGGLEAIETLNLPPTLTLRSGSGGQHRVFRAPAGADFQTRACMMRKDGTQVPAIAGAWGVDVRAKGGLIVGPGSRIGEKVYSIELDIPIAELPASLAERLRLAPVRSQNAREALCELDTPAAIHQATKYLLTDADLAMEGFGGDWTTYTVAERLYDFGVSQETALELMAEHWNDRCSPPWDFEDLAKKVANALAYRQDPVGRDNPGRAFEVIDRPAGQPAATEPTSLLEHVADISLEELAEIRRNALVREFLHPGESGVIYGAPGAGKSFLALDLAYHLALGREYNGRPVKRVPVLYVALEGVTGFRMRMLAAAQAHGDPGDRFARLKLHVSLVRDKAGDEGMQAIIEAARQLGQKAGEPTGLIIVDTLARALPGADENAVADMMAFMEGRLGAISRATGAATLAVHHPNAAGGLRGSTSLKGAADLVLRIDRDDGATRRRAVIEKCKDGEEGPFFDFELIPTVLAAGDEAMTSCVVKALPPTAKPPKAQKVKIPSRTDAAFGAAWAALRAAGRIEERKTSAGERVGWEVPKSEMRAEFMKLYAAKGGNATEAKKKAWPRAIKEPPAGFEINGEFIWCPVDGSNSPQT